MEGSTKKKKKKKKKKLCGGINAEFFFFFFFFFTCRCFFLLDVADPKLVAEHRAHRTKTET
eukprot:NODE_7207_length_266_cov_121.700461_g6594_i0.p1 GENE.NODE_7207_length_266_cov_121.700461_g6594_i0~~NODE_7207_length_266_cov_121.700461_g6594_i0.p1  ORF type:complete len:61 (+),score=55.78 NODE_7207_length_266_cov_121.700461_g6594_i0:1-183(+)